MGAHIMRTVSFSDTAVIVPSFVTVPASIPAFWVEMLHRDNDIALCNSFIIATIEFLLSLDIEDNRLRDRKGNIRERT